MSRLSTLATSTLTPALNVRSTTLPVITFLSLERTKAPPLPGFTCWNSTTVHRLPSMFRVMPFLRSLLVATSAVSAYARRTRPSQGEKFFGGPGEDLRCTVGRTGPNDQYVLDPDTALAGQINTGLDGYRNTILKLTRTSVPDHRCFVDFQPDPVPQSVPEVLTVAGLGDHVAGGRRAFPGPGGGGGGRGAGGAW